MGRGRPARMMGKYLQFRRAVWNLNDFVGGRTTPQLERGAGPLCRFEYRTKMVKGMKTLDNVPRWAIRDIPVHMTPYYSEGLTIILPYGRFSPGREMMKELPDVQMMDLQTLLDGKMKELERLTEQQKLNTPGAILEWLHETSQAMAKMRYPTERQPLQAVPLPETVGREIEKEK